MLNLDFVFEQFPELETDRFILRKLKMSDAPNMFDYFSKDEVTKYYDLATFTSEQQATDLIERLLTRFEEGKQIRWGIALKETDNLIGTCGFHSIEPEHSKVEIGYELHPNYWNKGVMSEVISKILDYGFNKMELNRVEAFYDPENIASRKVLEKNGFIFEGVLRKRFFEKGNFLDGAISAILKEDYFK
ncbi:GNAT family protein [Bacillus sp. 31A1R]|uniref:GNAT family protein n=1 Tax=Robertmurraya mangrovi TaxID=3098077 RepID=A0ABU5IY26_9BACI|nr:GNAT family protein [Bacillus sp. 31A1R]MDZ5471997.1 GNAT family protein [Bacillus sp. 31A1R]